MKKTIYLLMLLVLASCGNSARNQLKEEIATIQKECPMDIGIMGSLNIVTYDEKDNNVNMVYIVNSSLAQVPVMKNNPELMSNSLKLNFTKESMQWLLKLMADAGASLTTTYKEMETGEVAEVTISNAELHDILNNPLSDLQIRQMRLQGELAIEEAKGPYSIGDGMIMLKTFLEGENIVYLIEVDENMYDMSSLAEYKESAKESMAEMFVSDPVMINDIDLYSSLDKGIVYRYIGSQTNNRTEIIFTPAELKELAE